MEEIGAAIPECQPLQVLQHSLCDNAQWIILPTLIRSLQENH